MFVKALRATKGEMVNPFRVECPSILNVGCFSRMEAEDSLAKLALNTPKRAPDPSWGKHAKRRFLSFGFVFFHSVTMWYPHVFDRCPLDVES